MRVKLLVACVLLAACSSGAETVTQSEDAASDHLGEPADAGGDAALPDVVEISKPQDALETWDFRAADEGGLQCAPGEGCFLDPCTDNEQCQSGWCVDHMGEGVCSLQCAEECPPGWSCQQVAGTAPDLVFVCVSQHANLCRPCATGDNCKSVGGAEDVCVDYGVEGSFCGGACATDEDCPWGFSCEESETVAGISTLQCVAEAGVCPCTERSIELGLWTPCEQSSEWGTCSGKRVCAEDGLSECDALAAQEESCNGIDDDCDGDVDEPNQVQGNFVNLCDDANPCTEDACDGESGCSHIALESGECLDGDACTIADHCEAGVCVGQAVDCDDEDPCTDDSCDGAGGCLHEVNSADCNDGDPCTVADRCEAGECLGTAVNCECQDNADCGALENTDLCDGTLVCDTSSLPFQCIVDPATVVTCPEPEGSAAPCLAPSCDPQSGDCSFVAFHEGYPCDDGDLCTVGDTCQAGDCSAGVAANCNDGNPCTDDLCEPDSGCQHVPNAATCNDGNVCTTSDTCVDGVCTGGVALACDDDNPCTDDGCDAETGCTHQANAAQCDDGNACTDGDHCGGGQCLSGPALVCDDDNPCTNDGCDPAAGCTHATNVAPCDDGDPCTLNDHCGAGVCVPGPVAQCDDGNPCTDDSCDEQGLCVHVANQAACDDGNACTTGDYCQSGVCTFTGPVDCDDDEICTTDQCDPAAGCVYKHNTNPCDDGDVCTVFDQCKLGVCEAGSAIDCKDDNPCTDDSCAPETGCVFVPNEQNCSDLNACTAGDTCVAGQCVPGEPITCNDENLCTDDSCDPAVGCLFQPNAAPCDDANACTAPDACANGACASGPALDCDDANPCTDDSCDVVAGCQHDTAADGEVCGPNQYWTCESGVCTQCQPDCAGKTCGDDGCGGSCGSCGSYSACNPNDNLCVQDKIYVIALNNAHQGALGGLSGADAMCNAEAAAAGINRKFVAFLSTSQRNVAGIFSGSQRQAQVVNRNNEQLFGSWEGVFQNMGDFGAFWMITFDGKIVDEGTGASPDWEDADCWHGTQQSGLPTGEDCSGWTTTGATGTATELDGHRVLGQETGHLCSQNLAVMCVSVAQ